MPNDSVTIMLPWPPSANEIWRSLRGGSRPYLAPKYRRFIKDASTSRVAQGPTPDWLFALPRGTVNPPPLAASAKKKRETKDEPRLNVSILLFPPHNRPYDVDNRIKPILDALTRCGFWRDDRFVRRLSVDARRPVQGGAAIVRVVPLDSDPSDETDDAIFQRFGLKPLDPPKSKKRTSKK